MSHPITYFNDEDKNTILELARIALADSAIFDGFADQLDLSDEVLLDLRERIEKVTDGVDIFGYEEKIV